MRQESDADGIPPQATPLPCCQAESTLTGERFLAAIVHRLVQIGDLSPRVSEALDLHVRGWHPAAAAQQMGCAYNTYRNHLATALRKLGAESASELLRVIARDLDQHPRQSPEATLAALSLSSSPG